MKYTRIKSTQGSKLEAAGQVPKAPKGRKARRQIYDFKYTHI